MKFLSAAILSLPVASAFVQAPIRPALNSKLSMGVVTGPGGKAATTAEEDLAMTLRIIMDHEARSATVSKDQFVSQMEETQDIESEDVDLSIPYDATAKLAYEASDKSMEFPAFKTQFLADAIADVIAKK